MVDDSNRALNLRFFIFVLAAAVASGAAAGERAPKVAFVTSVAGVGDLSQWQPYAGANTGLAAADAICQSLAATAGLANPSSFVAWLSDDTDDAYCRVHNLGGTVAGLCGQGTLPTAAGPWVRTDDFPWAERIELMIGSSGVIFTPLWLDENANKVSWIRAFTDTEPDGTQDGGQTNCGNWTDENTGLVVSGSVDSTTQSWTHIGASGCHVDSPLYCLETGVGTDLPDVAEVGALAFVTSTFGDGDLAGWLSARGERGAAAGDDICESLARSAHIGAPSSFKAWLSDSGVDAADRFTWGGPWIRLDGVVVAQNKADLVDGELFAPINISETGAYRGNYWVWTGTDEFGAGSGAHCDEWGSASDLEQGTLGRANSAGPDWSDHWIPQDCDGWARLYCLSEVSILIFEDGFESGGTGAW